MDVKILSHKIVKNKDLTIVGIKGSHDDQDDLIDKIIKNYSKINNILIPYSCQVVRSIDHEKGYYDTLVGFVVESKSIERLYEGFGVYKIPKNNYAVFEFSGRVDSFIDFIESIYTSWLPNSSYEHCTQNCTHIQFSKGNYDEINKGLPKESHTNTWDLWIPIKER